MKKIKTRAIDPQSMVELLKFHRAHALPYKSKRTNSRGYLTSSHSGNVRTNNESLPLGQLIYIQLVKKYILKNGLEKKIPKIDKKNIKFYVYSEEVRVGAIFKNCFELDLSSAYWETANKLGLISPDLYAKAPTINPVTNEPYLSKRVRVACIGSLAKVERKFTFNGKRLITHKPIRSIDTEHIWDYVCYKTGKVMMEAAKVAEEDFILFWTDAIFVTSEKAKRAVEKVFKQAGYDFKLKLPVKRIEFTEREILITNSEKIRSFPYAHKYMKY